MSSRAVLFVTAHPDDESLFFAPTIASAVSAGCRVHILSLTDGDRGGAGATRTAELVAAAVALGVDACDARVANVAGVRDGPDEVWDVSVASASVAAAISHSRARVVVTFDARGVTGHANHIATAVAVRRAHVEAGGSQSPWALYELRSVPSWRVFCGPIGVGTCAPRARTPWEVSWGTGAHAAAPLPQGDVAVRARGWLPCAASHRGMHAHASQYVWWRKLFVVAATYSYENVIRRV